MIINDLNSAGAMPTLEKMFLFAGQRQRIIANNIANIDTPNFQMQDVDPKEFQKMLGDAIDRRRSTNGGTSGGLDFGHNKQVQMRGSQMVLNPATSGGGVLAHDRNDRDLERLMQQLVENSTTFRVAADLMRQSQNQLQLAIAQRVV